MAQVLSSSNHASTAPDNVPAANTTFPSMYYDSPIKQMVFGADVTANDSLTAVVSKGEPYVAITALEVCNWTAGPTTGSRQLSSPVGSSDGSKPLAVENGQYVRLWVTVNVPKGSNLALGVFEGTVQLKGQHLNPTVPVKGTYLGTLMGTPIVQPATVAPGESVFVQICDAAGKPISDTSINTVIQGAPVSARYYQFPTAGTHTLLASCKRGSLYEEATVKVTVAGKALAFRTSLNTIPIAYEMPMLQATSTTDPYTATFSVGNTTGMKKLLKPQLDPTPPKPGATVPEVQPKPSLLDPMANEIADILKRTPDAEITHVSPKLISSKDGVTVSGGNLSYVLGSALTTPPAKTSYLWDFGDGKTETTQVPTVTHNFFSSIKAEKIIHEFVVACNIEHDSVTVKQTLVLRSTYGLCRAKKIIVPPITANNYASLQQIAFSSSLIVHNLEATAITLTARAIVPFTDQSKVPTPAFNFKTMRKGIVLAANSSTALGCYVSLEELRLSGAVANGFAVCFMGHCAGAGSELWPVRFTYYFRIRLDDSGAESVSLPEPFSPPNWNLGEALESVYGAGANLTNSKTLTGDDVTNTVAIPLSVDPQGLETLSKVDSAIKAGLTHITLKVGALDPLKPKFQVPVKPPAKKDVTSVPHTRDSGFTPWNPPPVAVNNECYPDDISDADLATAASQQLVCQLSSQASDTQTITIPSAFQNAQAGDVILSPAPTGDGDLIAQLFSALTPPQVHGHSGYMTDDFYEITHCTSSVQRITNNAIKNSVGIPTSLNGEMLQYGWPGCLTQSVLDATTSVPLKDPSGTTYMENSFNVDARGFDLIYPLVVKPLPENEASARPVLRKVAVTARSKGAQYDSSGNKISNGGAYYSFYCYTNPASSLGFKGAAGSDAGWAAGHVGAVCSSFVWLCCKENNLPLVTSKEYEQLSDFPADAVSSGAAQVGPSSMPTLDGLIYYPEAERLQGAHALRDLLMDQAKNQETLLGVWFGNFPGVTDAIVGPIADQLLNSFASGNPNLVGSSAWQTPGAGNAVSPDNIKLWAPPYFGYAEPLQYLPSHTETYTKSRWVKVIKYGSIKGVVTNNGSPVPNAHVWVNSPGVYTGADGSYTLSKVPIGAYNIQATAVITVPPIFPGLPSVTEMKQNGLGGQPLTLTTATPDITFNIALDELEQSYRRLDILYSINCDHGDDSVWPFRNPSGVESAGPFSRSLFFNPGSIHDSVGYSFDYAGGGLFSVNYSFGVSLLQDYSLEVLLTGSIKDAGGNVQIAFSAPPIYVAIGQTYNGGWNGLEQSGTGYHNGPANFSFSLSNQHQTG